MNTNYQNISGNKKHKDALFRLVFEKKKDLLALYNAINGTDYSNTDDLEITTLQNVLYITMKNDISFMIDCTMNLYEHQSSYNPNMPLRGALYLLEVYKIYADQRKINIYSSTLQKLPTPRFVVFYNGTKREPDYSVLRLSDAYETSGGCLECEAIMLNINYGHNLELMHKCRRLEEYAIFVDTVRKYTCDKSIDLSTAISLAIDKCIDSAILVDVLTIQRAEVHAMILETFDKELYEKDLIQTAKEKGIAEGMDEAYRRIITLQRALGKSDEEISSIIGQPIEYIQSII